MKQVKFSRGKTATEIAVEFYRGSSIDLLREVAKRRLEVPESCAGCGMLEVMREGDGAASGNGRAILSFQDATCLRSFRKKKSKASLCKGFVLLTFVRTLRECYGLSRPQLAKMLECSAANLVSYETGWRETGLKLALRIGATLQIDDNLIFDLFKSWGIRP